ncbi:dihydropteroate synthase [Shigella flexneri]
MKDPNQKSSVSQLKSGAHIINDIRSLSQPGACRRLQKPVYRLSDAYAGKSKTMQEAPKYDDVFAEVNRYFIEQIARCEQAGIAKEKIVAYLHIRFR